MSDLLFPREPTLLSRSCTSVSGHFRTKCIAAIDRDLLGQVVPNFRQQLARAKRFWHVVIAARRPCLLFFATERIGGDRNDRDRSQRRIGFNSACGRITV